MRLPLLVAGAVVLGALVASATLHEGPPSASSDGDEGALEAASAGSSERDARSRLDPLPMPTWEEGDAWRVQFDEGDPVCWFVVVSANASGYLHGIWCPDEEETRAIAAQIAGFDQGHFGEFTRDLSGERESEAIRYFDWPLADGKTWWTSYDGSDAKVEARVERGRYQMMLSVDGEPRLSYDYDPALRWWSRMEFQSGYELRVHERESGWELGAIRGVAEERFSFRRSAAQQLPLRPAFEVPSTDDMLLLAAERDGAFVHRFAFLDPDGETAWESTTTSNVPSGMGCFTAMCWRIVESEEGVWSLDDQFASAGEASYRAVGIQLAQYPPR